MENNALTNLLLKSLMPAVRKFVEGGKIDALFQELKSRYQGLRNDTNDSVEILITTESDGLEYVSVIELDPKLCVKKVMFQQRLSDLITELFTQAEL